MSLHRAKDMSIFDIFALLGKSKANNRKGLMESVLQQETTQSDRLQKEATTSQGEVPLTNEEQRTLSLDLMKIEHLALYNDNNNRVTQRNYLVLGIFIVSSALLPLAIQGGVSQRELALFYNIVVFFLMLLWTSNTDKIGEQNTELLQIEKRAGYQGIQSRRAIQRRKNHLLILPNALAVFVSKPTVGVPHMLAVRWGKQYWGTVGLVLSTDLLTLYLAGLRWDPLTIAAILCTFAVPAFIRHQRPVEEEEKR